MNETKTSIKPPRSPKIEQIAERARQFINAKNPATGADLPDLLTEFVCQLLIDGEILILTIGE